MIHIIMRNRHDAKSITENNRSQFKHCQWNKKTAQTTLPQKLELLTNNSQNSAFENQRAQCPQFMNTNSPSSLSWQESLDSFSPQIACQSGSSSGGQHQRKKRSKLKLEPIPVRKEPDVSAAKITRPCSECGRRFWSWKALFGHMRCHPERQWRGINPPPNIQRAVSTEIPSPSPLRQLTEEDHEIAASLLMLANGCSAWDASRSWVQPYNPKLGNSALDCQFVCSSWRRNLGSHQELLVHSASHKKVKDDFVVALKDGEDNDNENISVGEGKMRENEEEKMLMIMGHKCSICLKIFSTGQALGGHKRCHWEKADEHGASSSSGTRGFALDLNLPAPQANEDSSSDLYGTKAGEFKAFGHWNV